MTTHIGINLCWLVPGVVGGSEQATVRMLEALDRRDPSTFEISLFGLDAFAAEYPGIVSRFETHTIPISGRHKPLRVAAEHTWLPRQLRRQGIDILHDAGGTSPGRTEIPRILTIHDIQPIEIPENFSTTRVAYLRWALPRAVAGAARIVVPSSFVRERVVERLGADPDRVSVVPWCRPRERDHSPVEVVRGRWGLDGPYLLLPAITYPHKDHVTAIRAMAHLSSRHPELKLVLAGGRGPSEGEVLAEIGRLDLGRRVVRTGHLSTASVLGLMDGADVVVFPSRYEGFGIPALEAMAAGTPVVVADAGALPEVVGNAGLVVPAGDAEQLAIEIHRLLSDDELRRRCISSGMDRADDFGPERTAEAVLAAYRSVVAGR